MEYPVSRLSVMNRDMCSYFMIFLSHVYGDIRDKGVTIMESSVFLMKWRKGRHEWEGDFLKPQTTGVEYDPLEHTCLFHEFERTGTNKKAIKGFAGKYGSLRRVESSVKEWRDEITQMQEAVWLWRSVTDENTRKLGDVVHWSNGGVSYKPLKFDIPNEDSSLYGFRRGEIIKPSKLFLSILVNNKIKNVKARLTQTDIKGPTHDLLGPWKLAMIPDSLLSAMWFQLARAIAENKLYRDCSWCNTPFEIATGKGRSDKQYCSDKCRQAASRDRRSKTS